jgi:hypothetical protein
MLQGSSTTSEEEEEELDVGVGEGDEIVGDDEGDNEDIGEGSTNNNDAIVSIYDSDNYKKELAKFVKTGKYSFTGKYKTLNNDMGSIKIKKGYKVDLFNDTNFKEKLINNLNKSTSVFKANVKNQVGSISISKI